VEHFQVAFRAQLGFDEFGIPKPGQVIPAGAIADRVAMDSACVGVSNVRHLPDGWSVKAPISISS